MRRYLISDAFFGSNEKKGTERRKGCDLPSGMCAEKRLMDLTWVEFDGKKPDLINEIDSVELKALASSREQVNRWSELALTLSGWNFTVIDISKVLGWNR